MKKHILMSFGIMIVIFLIAQGAFAITIKLSDRKGVVTNDNIDDSGAVQKAFNEILQSGGGTIEFPAGVVDIKTGIIALPDTYKPVNIIMKGDGGSIIRVSVGGKSKGFYFGSINRLQIDNLVFTGVDVPVGDARFIDGQYIIFAGWVSLISISNTAFLGLAVPSEGAIIHASSNLTIDNSQFDGNSAAYPDGAVISLDCCTLGSQNANISNTTFIDFTYFNGQYISKTGAFTGNWIRAKQMFFPGDPGTQRISVSDSIFDEGATAAINAEHIGAIIVQGTTFNINGTSEGTGIRADDVKRIRVEDSLFGWSAQNRPLAILSKSTAEMVGVTRSHNVQCPQTDPETTVSWRLSDCH